ncbi:MAG: MOSC domain-containing protein [Actinomycetota bacterium]|nr:MOSC domain-containing protein [Actinomycetota bacterium]
MTARVLSINVGTPVVVDWADPVGSTAIMKKPVAGPLRVEELGLVGDQVADTKDHGGIYQAVYAFSREDLDLWAERLGRPIDDGRFGENLTTHGIDVNEALIGEQWRIGTTTLEVIEVRIPCNVFKSWMGLSGFDARAWVKRFAAEGRPGPYLRVVEPGHITAGDDITVVHKPDHDVTVSMMFKAFTTDRSLLPRLLDVGDALPPDARAAAEKYAAHA